MIRALLLAVLLGFTLAPAQPAIAAVPTPIDQPNPVVLILTSEGAILVEVDARHAPITAANFLRYAQEGRLDGTSFYRTVHTRGAPMHGFIQGGIGQAYVRMLDPIAHEPTTQTGLHHVDGSLSMARTDPGTATCNFSILLGAEPGMDAGPHAAGDHLGYAVFGHVVAGMNVVRRIHDQPIVHQTGTGPMINEMIAQPVRIIMARRVG